jgi:ERCC4-type nuclease
LREKGLGVLGLEEDAGPVEHYILASDLAVSRRTGWTLLRGIEDKSLFTEAIDLGERFERAVLVVEGEVDYERTAFNPQAVRGALSAMVIQYGVSVLATSDATETARMLAMMTRHAQEGVPEISLIPKRKAVDLPDLQRRVVEMLPRCGRVIARRLLQYFGSIERIVEASPRELTAVQGIGVKTAEAIVRVLHTSYRSVDVERDLEDAIEARPALLFDQPVTLLARQHVISLGTVSGRDRDVVDLVFSDQEAEVLWMVELKHGPLLPEHEAQLVRYLHHAEASSLVRPYLEQGYALRGVLATVMPSDFVPEAACIEAIGVDEEAAIDVLASLRAERLGKV